MDEELTESFGIDVGIYDDADEYKEEVFDDEFNFIISSSSADDNYSGEITVNLPAEFSVESVLISLKHPRTSKWISNMSITRTKSSKS